jgi:phosphoribosylformylglycinamidine cyclo-ligase
VTDEEMFKTFNMGWGFGVIVDKKDSQRAVDLLSRFDVTPQVIGEVTDKERVVEIEYKNKHMILS